MKKLKTAVVGLGRIGWCYHIPQVIENDKFELTALVDPLEERRLDGKDKFKVNAYKNMKEMFENESLDVLVIASPTQFHKEQTLLAMQNGCDVFCDKPAAMNLDELDEMIAFSEKSGRKLMVYQPHRATREAISIYNIIRQDYIGPLYMIKRATSDYRRRNDWQAFKKHGGGMLSNFGVHFLDQLLFITDFSPICKVNCALRNIVSLGDADDTVKGFFENEDGVILDFDINMATAFRIQKWQIFGKYGTIIDDGQSWKVRYVKPENLVDLHLQDGLAAEDRAYLVANDKIEWEEINIQFDDYEPVDFYEKVYDYFALDKTPYVPVGQTREIMRLINECSIKAGAGGNSCKK